MWPHLAEISLLGGLGCGGWLLKVELCALLPLLCMRYIQLFASMNGL
eukprot:SAG31_NODE_35_length_31836_cov_10.841352_17_plen_47_part_00